MDSKSYLEKKPMIPMDEATNLLACLSVIQFGIVHPDDFTSTYEKICNHIKKIMISNIKISKLLCVEEIFIDEYGMEHTYIVKVDHSRDAYQPYDQNVSTVNILELLNAYNIDLVENGREKLYLFDEAVDIEEVYYETTDTEESESDYITNTRDDKIRRKAKCRALAQLLWEMNPSETKVAMARRDELARIGCEGYQYKPSTIEEWIKELNPDRNPGRRPEPE